MLTWYPWFLLLMHAKSFQGWKIHNHCLPSMQHIEQGHYWGNWPKFFKKLMFDSEMEDIVCLHLSWYIWWKKRWIQCCHRCELWCFFIFKYPNFVMFSKRKIVRISVILKNILSFQKVKTMNMQTSWPTLSNKHGGHHLCRLYKRCSLDFRYNKTHDNISGRLKRWSLHHLGVSNKLY
jgi:hypothetical protein